MREVSHLNPPSYLCWSMHVGKQPAAMLTTKRLAGIAPEMNLRKHISYMPLSSANKAAQKSPEIQNRGISGPTKMTYVLQKLKKKS